MHFAFASVFMIPLALVIVALVAMIFTGTINKISWRSLRAGQRRKLARNMEFNRDFRNFAMAFLRFARPVAMTACLIATFVIGGSVMGFAKQVAPSAPKMSPEQLNAIQRQAVLSNSVEMTQQISSGTTASLTAGNIVQVSPRNVGLIKRFIVEVTGTVTTSVADALTLSDFGVANLLSNVQFTDLNNNVRINTSGWHLAMLNSYKKHFPFLGAASFGAVGTSVQDGLGGGSPVFAVVSAPPTIAASTTGAVRFVYEVPLAYSDTDLTGAIYANVVNATMALQLTINPTSIVQNTVDSTFAVYTDAQAVPAGTTLNNVTVTVYQVYLDQLPIGQKGGVVLPILDLSTVYELKNTSFTGLVVNQDFPMPYANFRKFLSTCAVYNNTAGSAGRTAGTDISYWALQSANFTNIWKKDPLLAAQHARDTLKTDFAKGAYYFSHRRKPISTTQYGNMELILNPSVVGAANAYVLVGWEDFALTNTLTQAGSLAG